MSNKSLIKIVNELYDVKSLNDKKNLSQMASERLVERQGSENDVVQPVIDRLLFSPNMTSLLNISQTDFYVFRPDVYQDSDGLFKIVIKLSFLQHMDDENLVEDLDEKVASYIVNILKMRNLDIIVNDVCVNSIHYYNGMKL